MAFLGLVKRKLSFENNVHLWTNWLHVLIKNKDRGDKADS
jgi:hypothetical protein